MAFKKKLAEIYTEFTARTAPLKIAMAKANAIVKRGYTSMKKWIKRGAVAIGVGLVAALTYATKAASKQEDAEAALTAALRKTGDATEDNTNRLKRYASSLQEVTKYGDEEILAQMAYAKNLGVSVHQLRDAAVAAIGLAAAYKLDLKQAMMLVGRASQGQTESLTRYGIVLRDGLSDQEKFNEVLKIGASNFSLAEEEAKTTSGTLTKLWNVIGDIAERIGEPLLTRLKEVAERMLDWTKANEEWIETKIDAAVDAFGKALIRAGEAGKWMYEKREPIKIGFLTVAGLWLLDKGWKILLAISSIVTIIGRSWKAVSYSITLVGRLLSNLWYSMAFKGYGSFKMLITAASMLGVAIKAMAVKAVIAIATIATSLTAAVALIGIIVVQVGLLVNAVWSAHKSKKKIRAHEKAATKEEIEEYKAKIRGIKDEATEKRKAAKEQRKADAITNTAAKAKQDAIDKANKAASDAAKAEEKRLTRVKEKEDAEKEKAANTKKVEEERKEQQRLAVEKERQLQDNIDNELSLMRMLFTDAKGKEEKLAAVKDRLRKREARSIAEQTGVSEKEALDILEAKARISTSTVTAAVDAARVGFASFQSAWSQIASGASQVEKEIAKSTKETAEGVKELVTVTKEKSSSNGGFTY